MWDKTVGDHRTRSGFFQRESLTAGLMLNFQFGEGVIAETAR
jgi:hypothetical protein